MFDSSRPIDGTAPQNLLFSAKRLPANSFVIDFN